MRPTVRRRGVRVVLTLHVNNEPCTAQICAPMVGGVGADDCCGVLGYHGDGDSVTIPWQASHPHGFATYVFSIKRGARDVFSQGSAPVGGGSFSASTSVGYLMTTNPAPSCTGECTVAGFTENLSVIGTATDGWNSPLYRKDDARAFVLSHL